MIKIINIGKKNNKKTKYQVMINDELICEFWHNRMDGLGMCLLEASKTVERNDYLKIKEQLSRGWDKLQETDKGNRNG